MNQPTKDQKRRRRTVLYLLLLLALLITFVAASYTWFSLSRTPRVSEMDIFVSAPTGIELAPRPDSADEDWSEVLDFAELVGGKTALRPATWSQQRGCLVSCNYGTDGRLIGLDSVTVLTDERNANRNDAAAYYVKGTFYARTGSPVAVTLSDAVTDNAGQSAVGTYVIGTPLWDAETLLHSDGGHGAETAIRLGLRLTKVNPKTGEALDGDEFYIYEPNYDAHIDPQHTGDLKTPSIDGAETLIDAAHLLRQTASAWSEADPVQAEVTVKTLGKFDSLPTLFTLVPGEMMKIDLFIWLEGQDADCTNRIEDAQIVADLRFGADYSAHGGLVDIPNGD